MVSLENSTKCLQNSHFFYIISARKYKMKEPFLIHFMKLVLTMSQNQTKTLQKKKATDQFYPLINIDAKNF